jgi:hypothetical protein
MKYKKHKQEQENTRVYHGKTPNGGKPQPTFLKIDFVQIINHEPTLKRKQIMKNPSTRLAHKVNQAAAQQHHKAATTALYRSSAPLYKGSAQEKTTTKNNQPRISKVQCCVFLPCLRLAPSPLVSDE